MKKEEIITLGREDMIEAEQQKDLRLIKFDDFKISNITMRLHGIILFIDKYGETRILKNRYGDLGH